jgi:hypothetical protein
MLPIINSRKCHFGIENHMLCEICDFESSSSSNAKLMAKVKTHHEINDEFYPIEDEIEEDDIFDKTIKKASLDYQDEMIEHDDYTETIVLDDEVSGTYSNENTRSMTIEDEIKASFFQKIVNFFTGGTIGSALFSLSFLFIIPFGTHTFNWTKNYATQLINKDATFNNIFQDFNVAFMCYACVFLFVGMVWALGGGRAWKHHDKNEKKILKNITTIPISLISSVLLFFILKDSFSFKYLLDLFIIGGTFCVSAMSILLGAIGIISPFLGAFYFKGFKSLKTPSLFSKIKNKLFSRKAKVKEEQNVGGSISSKGALHKLEDFTELFDEIREKLNQIEPTYQVNDSMIQYFQNMKSSIEHLQISLHTLLHSGEVNFEQDAKTMIEIALPNMFKAYFTSLEKVTGEEAQTNTLLFLNTLVRLEEKFCLLAKDVVELDKNQKNLNLNEALQFAESRFLQNETHKKTMNSSL